MSETSYHDSVTVQTEVKPNDDIYYLNITNFKFFGLSEKAIQTDLTLEDIKIIDNNNKQKKDNKMKLEPLVAPSTSSNKKEVLDKLMEPFKNEYSENKLIEATEDNNTDDYMSNLSKSAKKTKKEDKKEVKKNKDSFMDKKRKRDDEDKQSPSKNKSKLKEVNKIKEKEKEKGNEKEKSKSKSLKEKSSKLKQKDEKLGKSEKIQNSSEKKEKQEK